MRDLIDNEEDTWSLIAKVLSGNATATEEQALLKWRQQSENNEHTFTSCQRIWEQSKGGISFDADAAWVSMRQRLHFSGKPSRSKRISVAIYAVAASVFIVLATTFLVRIMENSVTSLATKEVPKQLVLSDGTVVEVNRNSCIEYPRKFGNKNREVKLISGEAFFAVKADALHPFIVTTSSARVEVLGTQFNVKIHADGNVQVLVQSGKVLFQSVNTASKLMLTRNEGATYSVQSNTLEKVDSVDWNLLAWKTHRLVFRDAELAYVYKMISTTFGKVIQPDSAIVHNRLTATFENLTLEEILKIIDRTFLLQTQSVNDSLFWVSNASTMERIKK